jgi:hypothetical protein
MTKKTPIDPERSKALRDNAFREVNRYEPDRVRVVREKYGEKRANRMKAAIALDKARSQGAKV